MTSGFWGTNRGAGRKAIAKICLLVLIILINTGCAHLGLEENEETDIDFEGIAIDKTQYYAIYDLTDGRYLYEIYNLDGVVVLREILYKCPTITIYESRYLEMFCGAGTGVWWCRYYDLETNFLTDPLQGVHYVGDGIAALVAEDEEGERVLRLVVPFSYSEFSKDIKIDFASEEEILIAAICLKDISIEGDKIKVTYLNKAAEEETILLDNPAADVAWSQTRLSYSASPIRR